MEGANRQKWLEILETLAQRRPDEAEAEWVWVMKQLGLGPEYFLAIHEAIRQGRWRGAENPAGYLKAVARREARRAEQAEATTEELTIGGGEVEGEWLSGEEMLDALEYRQHTRKPAPGSDGTWRAPNPSAQTPARKGARSAFFRLITPKAGRRFRRPSQSGPGPFTPEQIRSAEQAARELLDAPYIHDQPERNPDWPQWAQAAGLSEWEKKVIEYKLSGVGWREAVAAQADAVSRRALRAAWRRLERSGFERLKKNLPLDVAQRGESDTEE
jgi:hypothetical protein